jgi:molybdopterin-guanine dinucleotide biosynthesis protein A
MNSDITLAILAGGQGSRMGKPKAELIIHGLPILRFLLQQLNWPGPTLLVTAPTREHPPAHEDFNTEAIDPMPDMGPLGGVITALDHARTDWVLLASVDMPGLSPAQLDWLIRHRGEKGLLAQRSENNKTWIEPFPCILHRSLVEIIRQRYASGDRSVKGLAEIPGIFALPAPLDLDPRVWSNLNRPEDLREFT